MPLVWKSRPRQSRGFGTLCFFLFLGSHVKNVCTVYWTKLETTLLFAAPMFLFHLKYLNLFESCKVSPKCGQLSQRGTVCGQNGPQRKMVLWAARRTKILQKWLKATFFCGEIIWITCLDKLNHGHPIADGRKRVCGCTPFFRSPLSWSILVNCLMAVHAGKKTRDSARWYRSSVDYVIGV